MTRISAALMAIAAVTTAIPTAQAAEVQFEGFYRARGRAFDSLSLMSPDQLDNSEGLSAYAQHRFWLKPRFVLSENAAIFTEFRGLDGVHWGDQPYPYFDPTTQTNVPSTSTDSLGAPAVDLTTGEQATEALRDFTLWRAWGEIHTDFGRFRFGRMPLHWGQGIWQNDGTRDDDGFKDFGDTADRISWEKLIDDSVFVMAAVDVNSEGYLNLVDDTTSFNLGVAYRSERVVAGLNGQYRTRPVDDFSLVTISGALDAEIGTIALHFESVGQFGSGDLDNGANDVRITAGATVLEVELEGDSLGIELDFGFASGDGNSADANSNAFTFDRDYNVGLIMFEQTMPVLSTNGTGTGRNSESALTGPAISNAIFVRPAISRTLADGLEVEAAAILARPAAVPDDNPERKGYGTEFDVGLEYEPFEHVSVGGTFGVFLPGTWYSEFDTDNFDFSRPVLGGQLVTNITF